jgi:predicted nucleic acid-binding protein
MRTVFADTAYWVAIVNPRDQFHEAAKAARQQIGPCVIATTDEVLAEFLNAFTNFGSTMKRKAAETVRAIISDPNVEVIPQSRDTFLRALDRYSQRIDQRYSFVDCSSMVAMERERMTDVLTGDGHFQEAGFNVLIRGVDT